MQDNKMSFRQKLGAVLMMAAFGFCANVMAKDIATVPATQNAGDRNVTGLQTVAAPEQPAKPQPPAMARTQAPGFYRTMVGQFEVTALFDGVFEFNPDLLKNASKQEIDKALTHHYGKLTGIQSAVNAYLINTGEHLVLVDAGAGQLFSEDRQGHMMENLKASGYQPEQVDTIVMTHLHGDHTGGLSNKEGSLLFPNATVYANKAENEYWLSEKVAAAAPPEKQMFFKLARESAVPYLSAEKWKPVEAGAEIVPGIKAVAAYGHTPGHTAFQISSDGQQLLIWGDIVHSHAIQFNRPEIAIEYDSDAEKAVMTRKNLLKEASEMGELVAGMHLPFPGLGYVRSEGNGKYSWVPVEYTPMK